MPTKLQTQFTRVAVVHDWLTGYRGGEKVLEAILELFPQADIFTLFYDKGSVGAKIESHKIFPSFLNKLRLSGKSYRYLLPLFPFAIEQFDLREYDLVISSSHCVAKGVIPAPTAKHLCYCHSPMRYIWDQTQTYFPGGLKQKLAAPVLTALRMWDVTSSHRVDTFVANSHFVAKRIEKYYRRQAEVIYPFADESAFQSLDKEKEDFYLVVSALVPYKRVDLAIEACEKLKKKLVIIGSGEEKKKLKKLSTSHLTTFAGHLTSKELLNYYQKAKALILPAEEDFGIAPVEAMASGTPVIALAKGGALETVIPGETGLLFPEQTKDSLIDHIQKFETTQISPTQCQKRAQKFTKPQFQSHLTQLLLGDGG